MTSRDERPVTVTLKAVEVEWLEDAARRGRDDTLLTGAIREAVRRDLEALANKLSAALREGREGVQQPDA